MLSRRLQGQLRKPLLVVAVTDGAPGGEARDTIVRVRPSPPAFLPSISRLFDMHAHTPRKHPQVIKNASNTLGQTRYGPDALSVQIAQIGNDNGARKFLEELDEDPVVGGLIDCTSESPPPSSSPSSSSPESGSAFLD